MYRFSFENLKVWSDSRILLVEIYKMTENFPDSEKFGLTSQIRRASVSVSCNIAEGSSRWSSKEKIRFIEIAFGSLMEVLNCLILSVDLQFLEESQIEKTRVTIEEIARQLNGLKKSFTQEQK